MLFEKFEVVTPALFADDALPRPERAVAP